MQWITSFIILFLSQKCLTSPKVSYQQMGFGQFCPDSQSVITSVHECQAAKRSLFEGLQEDFKEINDQNGFPGCAYAKEKVNSRPVNFPGETEKQMTGINLPKDGGGVEWMGRSQVIFNHNTNARSPRNLNNYAALCSTGNNKVLPDWNKLDRNCIEKNTNTQGRDKIGDLNLFTRTWNQCAEKCRTTNGCLYWTWHTKLATGYENKCVLMEDFGNKATDKSTISGTKESKDCEAIDGPHNQPIVTTKPPRNQQIVKTTPKPKNCIERNKNYTSRQTQIGSPITTTGWDQCEKKCRANSLCHYWTWATKTAPKDLALKCILLSGRGRNNRVEVPIKMKDTNAISGKPEAKDCIDKDGEENCIEMDKNYKNKWTQIGSSPMTDTWEKCSQKCRAKDGCAHWTWATDTAPTDIARKCILLSGTPTSNREEEPMKDINAISGKPGAGYCGIHVTKMFMVLYSIVAVLLLLAVLFYNLHSLVKRRKSA